MKGKNFMISLIMATLGRKNEVDRYLQSLCMQTYTSFELIIVDQNPEYFLSDIIKKYKDKININHILTAEKGLSKARNLGLKYIHGDIIGFPDDDCVYRIDTLQNVVSSLQGDIDAVTGTVISNLHQLPGNMMRSVNIYNVWCRGISFTIFLKKHVLEKVGYFDEMLGVGSGTIYGSGEETDYLIRILKARFCLQNTNSILVWHPNVDYSNYKKAYSYSKGRVYVLNKHGYNFFFIQANTFWPLVKLIRHFYNIRKAKYCWYQFLGRL